MDLKPCPFCGSKNIEISNGTALGFWAVCMDCQALGPTCSAPEKAAEAWNYRYESLTIDKLRQLDGEPVWNDTAKCWSIVDVSNGWTINRAGQCRPLDDQYYRRRPEEENNAAT